MKSLEIRTSRRKQVTVMHLVGAMARSDVAGFDEKIGSLLRNGKNKIVLECTSLEYLPSSGLGVIIGSLRQVRSVGGDIKIGGITPVVNELLETIGFTTLFEIYSTEEAALEMFGEN